MILLVASSLRGRILFIQSLWRNLVDADVGCYRHRDTVGRVLGSFNRLTSATRRIHSASVPRKAQIPSRASTCPVASFLESWPGRVRGRVRVYETDGRFLLSCCSIRRRETFFFYSIKMGIKIQQRATDTSYSSEIDRIRVADWVFLQQVALFCMSRCVSVICNVWHLFDIDLSQFKHLSPIGNNSS